MSDRPTLKQAMILVSRRKMAVASKIGSTGIYVQTDDSSARQVLSGTDLTLEEIAEAALEGIKPAAAALLFEDSVQVPDAMAGCWVDGILVGLMLAQLRAQAALHEEQQIREQEAEMRRRNG